MIDIGHRVEVRPAYNMDTGERDIIDEIAYCEGRVVEHGRDGYHIVEIGGERHEIYVARLRDLTRIT